MELLIQPDDGLTPLIRGIERAKRCVEIVIFRCDRLEIEKALAKAVDRGVFVHALIAYTNRDGEKHLRELEMRLLAAGVTVARTADDLVRYHDKLLIVDRRKLYLLAFNFTYLDIKQSRSFGIVTTNNRLVQEAVQLFEADTKRVPYKSSVDTFVVSPVNARRELAALIKKAKKELLIYDPTVSDPAMIRLLEERAEAGVEVRIIGRLARKSARLKVRKMRRMRLHVRAIIRDGRQVFVGSQSLRAIELDGRREAGIIVHDAKIVRSIARTFLEDWEAAEPSKVREAEEDTTPAEKVAKKLVKVLSKDLPPVAPALEAVKEDVARANGGAHLSLEQVEQTVSDAMKEAIKEAVRNVVEDTFGDSHEP